MHVDLGLSIYLKIAFKSVRKNELARVPGLAT